MTDLYGFDLDDTIVGTTADDEIEGGTGNDVLHGRLGEDELKGEEGTDTLFGGGNADTLNGGFAGGGDSLFGGAGRDVGRFDMKDGTGELVFSLADNGATSFATIAGSTGAMLVGIEEVSVVGSNLNDTLSGNSGDDSLVGISGNDSLFGASGGDTLNGGAFLDRDLLDGGSGIDRANLLNSGEASGITLDLSGAGTASVMLGAVTGQSLVAIEEVLLHGTSLNDTVTSGIGNDTMHGVDGQDQLYGEIGDDTLYGGDDFDSVFGGSGADFLTANSGGGTLNGGSGSDAVFHSESRDEAVTVDAVSASGAFFDVAFSDIETFRLRLNGDGAVTFIGEEGNDYIRSDTGADLHFGGAGDDSISAGSGVDTLFGDLGDDDLSAGVESDILFGGSGNDLLRSGSGGSTTLSGGSGIDTFAFFGLVSGDTLVRANAGVSGIFQAISYSGIEALDFNLLGSANVTLRGGDGNDILRVNSGNDTLVGFSGDDYLRATKGVNTLFGGSGVDTAFLHLNVDVGPVVFDQIGFTGSAAFADGNRVGGVERLHLVTGSGDDTLKGGGGENSLYGGAGDDTIRGGAGDDLLETYNSGTLFGGAGDDTLEGKLRPDGVYVDEEADFSIFGGAGDDELEIDAARESTLSPKGIIDGQSGDDDIGLRATDMHYATLYGGSGNDYVSMDIEQADTQGLDGKYAEIFVFGGAGEDTVSVDTLYLINDASVRVYGGEGADHLYAEYHTQSAGTADDITLFGGLGADLIGSGTLSSDDFSGTTDFNMSAIGGSGRDAIFGGDEGGNDYIRAGSGLDFVYASTGDDTFVVGEGELVAGEKIVGGSGSDTLFIAGGNSAANLLDLSEIEVVANLFAGGGDDHLFGNEKDDDLRGQNGNDFLYGLSGDDSLRGGSGNDSLEGRSGLDTLFGGTGDDVALAGDGADRVIGGLGADLMYGGSGADTLNGANGVDTAYGGRGNDTFIVDTMADHVVEYEDGGSLDLLRSDSRRFHLGSGNEAFVEKLVLNQTAGAAELGGSDIGNTLVGNAFDNFFFGREGDDVLNGRGGSDTLVGGLGDDTFVVDTATDQVRDRSGAGVDLVRAETDYTLPDGTATAFVENLRLEAGAGGIDGTGNSLDNRVEGNTGANRLAGNQGADHLLGGGGGDTLFGGQGGDTMEGEGGSDTLNLGAFDTAFGGLGADSFLVRTPNLAPTGTGAPLIGDFDGEILGKGNGADKLVFATGLEVGNFSYIRGQAFSAGGESEARFAGGQRVDVDRDGDGTTDISFLVEGLSQAGSLTSSDFIWL